LEKSFTDNKSLKSCGLRAKELQNILYALRAMNATLGKKCLRIKWTNKCSGVFSLLSRFDRILRKGVRSV